MRKSCFALKALCGAPSLWVGGILSFLFVLPCQSQVPTYANSNNSPAANEGSILNRNADAPSYRNGQWNKDNGTAAENNGYADYNAPTSGESADNIDNVRQMIDASLPIVKRLSSQSRPYRDSESIDSLINLMNIKVNGENFGYYDVPEMQRRNFTKSDFQGFYYVLLSVDKSLSDLQETQMDNSDIRYVLSMDDISQELFRSNFIGRMFPSMIIKSLKEKFNSTMPIPIDDVVITIYDEIDLLNNHRYRDFQPKNFEEFNTITNQTVLVNVAKNHNEVRFRIAAVNKLTSQNEIYNVARNDVNSEVRLAALRNLDSETFIYNIARNDGNSEVRRAAVSRLTSETYLYNIARNDGDSQIRLIATNKITSETYLYNIARNDGNSEVRRAAVSRLTSETYLYNIARNDANSQIRLIATNRITSETYLYNIARNDGNSEVRRAAVKGINSETYLYNIARNDADSQIRLMATSNISSQTYLYNIARNDSDSKVRLAAVRGIKDDTYLRNIANNDSDPQVRRLALDKL